IVSGSGSLPESGSGTLLQPNDNTYPGTTPFRSGGTLQVGNGGATGSLGTGNVTDNGTLAFNRSDTITIANLVSGTGALTQAGSGTLILTAANTYSGITTINPDSTLQASTDAATGSHDTSSLTDNGTL